MIAYDVSIIAHRISEALVDASRHLEDSLVERLQLMHDATAEAIDALVKDDVRRPRYEASLEVLRMIIENLQIANDRGIPMCQDTGMVIAFIESGPDVPLSDKEILDALDQGIKIAARDGFFRNSVVDDPVFERTNTGTNLPAVVHWMPTTVRGLRFRLMLKGFGSENCSALKMLNPTAGPDGVVSAVSEMVRSAGGKPCPPIVLGVGIGGTAERALQLSKIALLRKTGEPHPEPAYAELEQRIEEAVHRLEIGPGGFGGPLTALGVAIEHEPTHIAGLPVAVSISCWADRKADVRFGGSDGT
jgi:fumarate hydratase subunit alpha